MAGVEESLVLFMLGQIELHTVGVYAPADRFTELQPAYVDLTGLHHFVGAKPVEMRKGDFPYQLIERFFRLEPTGLDVGEVIENVLACRLLLFAQMGHLAAGFTGTDTITSVLAAERVYNANMEQELIASSVPATEHSVMTSYGKEDEIVAFERMLDLFPTGIVSVVSDSFDLWQVCTTFVTQLKDKILARNGKLVIRPDSGDPVDIVCGANPAGPDYDLNYNVYTVEQTKGVVELLWDAFGGTINSKGYKVLDSHIGVIYGDSISRERAEAICRRLEAKGFASNNVVFGIGSYTYNYNTRDSLGIAVKSTYCEVDGEARNIFKDPVTDDGMKKSARGLLRIDLVDGEYVLRDEVTEEEEAGGELKVVYENGKLLVDHTLQEIRNRVNTVGQVA